jgi:hypothetical protein
MSRLSRTDVQLTCSEDRSFPNVWWEETSNLLYRTVMTFPEAGVCVEYIEEQVSSVRLYGCALVWSTE